MKKWYFGLFLILTLVLTWAYFSKINNESTKQVLSEPKMKSDEIQAASKEAIQTTEQASIPTPATTSTVQLGEVHGMGGREHLRPLPLSLTNKEEWIHQDVYPELMAMVQHAQRDGIHLSIVSAYRSYAHQKQIWERKWGQADENDVNQALKILQYSSFPGTSRHHWGTDIDLNSVSHSYWESEEGQKVYQWLQNHAADYGFCQTYGAGRLGGYQDEVWHWSHMKTAQSYYAMTQQKLFLETVFSQNVKGMTAVRQLNNKLNEYIQLISSCVIREGKIAKHKIRHHIAPNTEKSEIHPLSRALPLNPIH